MNKLPLVGEDAFKDGFLSKKFGNGIIARINRPYKIVLPPGKGSAWVMESDENIVFNFTNAKLGWDGDWNKPTPPPYLPPWNLYPVQKGEMAVPFTYDPATGILDCGNINHGLETDSQVEIALAAYGGGSMSSAFSLATTYYARDTGGTTLKLAATAGGAAITGGTAGSNMTLLYAGIALKVNPQSTLMKTWDYRGQFADSTWKDKYDVSHFTKTFILTKQDQYVWLQVEFDENGSISSAFVTNGPAWSANLPYYSGNPQVSLGESFTWYQLLGYLKLSSDPGGVGNDVKIDGAWYKLMCPTTTHLMQGYIRASDDSSKTDLTPVDYIAIVPWYGCVWHGS